jgi:dTDP-4-amino-4,6-dideoxygalactose transaminase
VEEIPVQPPAIPLFKVFMAESVDAAVTRVLHSGYIGEGDEVIAFERELAARLAASRVITVNSATSALHLAYHIAIDGAADAEIITTPMTCIATNTPIVQNRARIVWADVDPLTGNIDPDEIEPLISGKTRTIVMVHWGGNPCDIDRICAIGRRAKIKVIEDAAHALGATYRGQPVGGHSDFAAFSFQAVKQVTSVDGGCLICRSAEDDTRGRLLRWYGIDRSTDVDERCDIDAAEAGYKFHMNNVTAAIGRENLRHLDWMLARHRDNARFYNEVFSTVNSVRVASENPGCQPTYWLYTIHIENRDELMAKLLGLGIGASKVHTRNDVHSAFKRFARPLPSCEEFNRTHLCIPVGWWLSEADRQRVADAVIRFAR